MTIFDLHAMHVRDALSHAARTFQSFNAADWRAMAEECRRRAEQLTCVDCGRDMTIGAAPPDPTREHLIRKDGRWTCGKP